MKYIWCILACFLGLGLSAQQIDYSEEEGAWERQRFIDTYDYVFLTKEPTKELFKLNMIDLLPVSFRINYQSSNRLFFAPRAGVGLIYERKVGQAWSINAGFSPMASSSISISSVVPSMSNSSLFWRLKFELEPRWYYDMRKRIISGKSANNLSGNYFGLGLSSIWDIRNYSFTPDAQVSQEYNILLKYGLQRRIFGKGYIDVNFGIGARNAEYSSFYDALEGVFRVERRWDLFYGAELGFGIAFGGAPDREIDSRLCDAFRCHLEENSMLRITLNRILQGNSSSGFSGAMVIEYERKLGDSYWSLNGELELNYRSIRFWTVAEEQVVRTSTFRLGQRYAIGLRYYYNLRQKIARGNSANNLSANYLTLLTGYEFTPQIFFATVNGMSVTQDDFIHNLEIVPAWGFQRRIFKHGFLDYKVGIGLGSGRGLDYDFTSGNFERTAFFEDHYWLFLSEIKFGLAF